MPCYVYRSLRQTGLYIYLAEADDFSRLPEALRERAGKLELALELSLTPERKLRRAEAAQVMASLEQRGYYVQMPETVASLLARH